MSSYILSFQIPNTEKLYEENFNLMPGCSVIILKLNSEQKTVLATEKKMG